MCSHLGFFISTENLRRPPCSRNSPWSGNYSILCCWKFVRFYPGATHYQGYFEMGRYAELSSDGGCAQCAVVSFFWHNFLGCGCLCFQRWFEGTSASFDKQNLSGNVTQKNAWKVNVPYYWPRSTRPRSSFWHLSNSAELDCTFLGLASLDIGEG